MRYRGLFTLAALAAITSPLAAQQSGDLPIELGVDAGIGFTSYSCPTTSCGSTSVTQISIPTGALRVGFFVSPALSIEPQFAINSYSGSGTNFTKYELAVGALYHFSTDRKQNQLYARPFIGISGFSGGGSSSSSQTAFGAGVGMKQPIIERLALRYELGVEHALSSGSGASATPASNTVFGTVGFSFFTH